MIGSLYPGAYSLLPPTSYDATANMHLVVDIGSAQNILAGSLSIQQSASNGQASFQVPAGGTRPVPFSPVRFGLGSLAPADLIFKGKQQNTTQYRNPETVGNQWWDGTAVDSSAEFNRQLCWGVYDTVSATTIAQDLLTKFAPDFSNTYIAAGLPNVSITFRGDSLDTAFNQLAKAIAGYYYRDTSYSVHLYITEVTTAPDPLDANNTTLCLTPALRWSANTSQVRNRIIGIGASTTLLSSTLAGETILPIADATIFNNAAGTVLVGSTRVNYAGKTPSAGGSLVGQGVSPSSAPALALTAGTGLGTGVYQYAYTDVTAAGETIPSPLGSITTGVLLPPTNNLGYTGTTGGGSLATGYYDYAITFVTAAGETTAGLRFGDVGVFLGQSVDFNNFDLGPSGVTQRKIYRTAVQTTPAAASTAQLKLLDTLADNTTKTYHDIASDASLGANVPTTNTATAAQIILSVIALGPSGTTSRKVYRTVVNGSQLKLQQTIANNTATVGVTDATADGSLGANAPTSDTSALTQPTGQVLAGATSMLLAGAGPFPTSGWAIAGTQLVRYTGITGNTLTGIPATGPGAIAATLPYGTSVIASQVLTGLSTNAGFTLYANLQATNVSLYTERNDLTSQAAIKAIENGGNASGTSTGIYEFKIEDSTLVTQTSLDARCDADLLQYASSAGIITVTFTTYDKKVYYGKMIHIDRAADGLVGDFSIQSVTITVSEIETKFACTASSIRFSLDDLFRRVVVRQ